MQDRTTVKVRDCFNRLNDALCVSAGAVVAGLAVLIVANVIGRRFFNQPVTGTLEITEALLVVVVILPMAYTQFSGGHVRVTLLTRHLSLGVARRLYVLGLCLGAAFFAWATFASAEYALQSWRIDEHAWGSAMRFPLYPSKAVITIGTGLLSLQFALDAIRVGIFGHIELKDDLDSSAPAIGILHD